MRGRAPMTTLLKALLGFGPLVLLASGCLGEPAY
jgi:hypothetical protein